MNRKSINHEAATEIEGPGGINMTGGDLTPHQNAGEKMDNANDERHGEQRMERRQMAGGVEQQTQVRNPSASNPDGMPDAIHGRDVENDEVNSE